MTTGAWIVIYLMVSLYAAAWAWAESRGIDLDEEAEHWRRLSAEMKARRHALAWRRLGIEVTVEVVAISKGRQ